MSSISKDLVSRKLPAKQPAGPCHPGCLCQAARLSPQAGRLPAPKLAAPLGEQRDCGAPSVREGRAEQGLLMGRARPKLSQPRGRQAGLLLSALPTTGLRWGAWDGFATKPPCSWDRRGCPRGITQLGPAAPPRCAGAVAVTAPGPQQEQCGPHAAACSPARVTDPAARGAAAMGGSSLGQGAPWWWGAGSGLSTPQGWRQQAARYVLAAQGEGTHRQWCRSSHHRLQLVSRGVWDALMPCEALDCQRVALTPVQHRTLSISEHLLPPGVPARLRLVPTSCAFFPVSRFLQLHSLSPAARQR